MSRAAEPIMTYLNKAATDAGVATSVTTDTGLLESGLLDSMGLVGLVQFIEERFDLDVPETDITPELFATPRDIIAYLDRRLG